MTQEDRNDKPESLETLLEKLREACHSSAVHSERGKATDVMNAAIRFLEAFDRTGVLVVGREDFCAVPEMKFGGYCCAVKNKKQCYSRVRPGESGYLIRDRGGKLKILCVECGDRIAFDGGVTPFFDTTL